MNLNLGEKSFCDLISLGDPTMDCRTGTLIDLSESDDKKEPFQSALKTLAEVDDTFGLFEMKPRSLSAPDQEIATNISSGNIALLSATMPTAKHHSVTILRKHSVSKESISSISNQDISVLSSANSITSVRTSAANGINDAFITSTSDGLELDPPRLDSCSTVRIKRLPMENSTPMHSKGIKTSLNDDEVFISPIPNCFTAKNRDDLLDSMGVSQLKAEKVADSSVESDLLDIENLSTFSISDSSDVSGGENKKGKYDFLSPRKTAPGSGIGRAKKELFHKNISSTTRRLLSLSSPVKKTTTDTTESTPLVAALRKKMAEKAAQDALESRKTLNAPLPTRRFFPSNSATGAVASIQCAPSSSESNLFNVKPADIVDSSFSSPEKDNVKNAVVMPTPTKEYAASARRQITTPTASRPRTCLLPTPTKPAACTPRRQSFSKPSTPTSRPGTNARSNFGSNQSLTSYSPVSKLHSFSSSSSSSGSGVGKKISLGPTAPVLIGPLVGSFKAKPMAYGAPRVRTTCESTNSMKFHPPTRIQPMKATVPIKGSEEFSNEVATINGCVSAPVHRKFVPPIAASSPKVATGHMYALGTPPRNRKGPIRSSGYGQQSMNTSKLQEFSHNRAAPSPNLANTRNLQYVPKITEAAPTQRKRPVSLGDTNTSKIGKVFTGMLPTRTNAATKENSIPVIRKPSFGK